MQAYVFYTTFTQNSTFGEMDSTQVKDQNVGVFAVGLCTLQLEKLHLQ